VAHHPSGNEWFRLAEPEPGIVMIEEPWHEQRVKSYLVVGEERAVLLDAGTGVGSIRQVVERLTDLPVTLVLSHGHWDHIGGAHEFAADRDVLIHPLAADDLLAGRSNAQMRQYLAPSTLSGPFVDSDLSASAVIPSVEPSGYLADGQEIDLGGRRLRVLHAPGHARGLIALWDQERAVLFSTDAVYAGALYAQMDDSNLDDYATTLRMLAAIEPAPRAVYPAHGESPMSPTLIPAMRDAMVKVVAGRQPEVVERGVEVHRFEGFSILAPAPDAGGPHP
jgi:glyoxylase-like metal-dependent hydrolase (beta-lactamase superfamily II)